MKSIINESLASISINLCLDTPLDRRLLVTVYWVYRIPGMLSRARHYLFIFSSLVFLQPHPRSWRSFPRHSASAYTCRRDCHLSSVQLSIFFRVHTRQCRALSHDFCPRELRDRYIITASRPSGRAALANPRTRFGCAIAAARN